MKYITIVIAGVLVSIATAMAEDTVTFTKAEVEAAYALGRADQARAQIAGTPDALSMARKLQPPQKPQARAPSVPNTENSTDKK